MTPREQIKWIQDDARTLYLETGARHKLAYLVSRDDKERISLERDALRGPGGRQYMVTVGTVIGEIEVRFHKSKPDGVVPSRAYRCNCGEMFMDDSSRSGMCVDCLRADVAKTAAEFGATGTSITTCARCAHQFIVTDGGLDAAVTAHHERCFVVGDRVRWEFRGNVVDGRLTGIFGHGHEEIWMILATSSSFHGAAGVGSERAYGTAHPAMVSHLAGPTATESMKQSWDAFDAAYPRRPPQVGDRIRWWPRVTHMGTPSADAEWLDGSVISLLDGRLIMEVTARSGSNATSVYRCYTLPLTLVRCVGGAEDGDTIPVDPLTVLYDGSRLGTLIEGDEFDRRETSSHWRTRAMTSAQRDAVSAHWSAELRAKLKDSKERERCQVVLDDDEMTIANCADVKDAD